MSRSREAAASETGERSGRGRAAWRRHRLGFLLALLLVATALRLWGCFGGGLPFSFNSDERGNVMRALRFGAEESLDPGWFNKPALGYYLIFAEYGGYYLMGRAAGWFDSADDFGSSYFNHAAPFFLIGRITFSILGALTVLVTAGLGRRLGGRYLGFGSAVVLAVIVGHMTSGQVVKMDVPAALFSTASLVAIVQVMRRGRLGDYVFAGALAGLSMATKYYGAALLAPLVLAHAMRTPRAHRRAPAWILSPPLLAGFASFAAGFFVGSPFNFLSPEGRAHLWLLLRKALGLPGPGQIFDFGDHGALRNDANTLWDAIEHLIGQLVSVPGIGLCLVLLLTLGLVRAALRRRRSDIFLLILFPYLILVMAVSNQQFARPRHLVMLYPVIAVFAASGFEFLWSLATRPWPALMRPSRTLLALGLLLAIPCRGFPLYDCVTTTLARTAEDPRLHPLRWIEGEGPIPAGAAILNDGGILPLRYDEARIAWAQLRVKRLEKAGQIDRNRIFGSLAKRWNREQRALEQYSGVTHDVLVMEHQWQAWEFAHRRRVSAGYNPLWMRSPWGAFMKPVLARFEIPPEDPVRECWSALREMIPEGERDLAPVELWTRVTEVSRPWLTVEKAPGGASRHRPMEWLVTSQAFVEEYQEEEARAAFPDYFSFYRDLVDHYACHEFPVPNPDAPLARMLRVRIYDLRERFEDRSPPLFRVE